MRLCWGKIGGLAGAGGAADRQRGVSSVEGTTVERVRRRPSGLDPALEEGWVRGDPVLDRRGKGKQPSTTVQSNASWEGGRAAWVECLGAEGARVRAWLVVYACWLALGVPRVCKRRGKREKGEGGQQWERSLVGR